MRRISGFPLPVSDLRYCEWCELVWTVGDIDLKNAYISKMKTQRSSNNIFSPHRGNIWPLFGLSNNFTLTKLYFYPYYQSFEKKKLTKSVMKSTEWIRIWWREMISRPLIKIILTKSRKWMIGKPVKIVFGSFTEMSQTRLYTDLEFSSATKWPKWFV